MKRRYKAEQNKQSLVYLDETGFETSTERLYAWGLPGKRLFDYRNGNNRKRTSLLGGYLNKKLIAPLLFEGCCNTAVFNAWLEKELLPCVPPGTILVLDNAAFHKSKSTQLLVEKAGCHLLFLPPYSPHLNPIEKLWANLKHAWRNASHLSLDQLISSSEYLWS